MWAFMLSLPMRHRLHPVQSAGQRLQWQGTFPWWPAEETRFGMALLSRYWRGQSGGKRAVALLSDRKYASAAALLVCVRKGPYDRRGLCHRAAVRRVGIETSQRNLSDLLSLGFSSIVVAVAHLADSTRNWITQAAVSGLSQQRQQRQQWVRHQRPERCW
jgi:hypothetical protein